MKIVDLKNLEREIAAQIIIQQWQGTDMVISSDIYDCTSLPGFAYLDQEGPVVWPHIFYIISKSVKDFAG